jgi:hypothetical protein
MSEGGTGVTLRRGFRDALVSLANMKTAVSAYAVSALAAVTLAMATLELAGAQSLAPSHPRAAAIEASALAFVQQLDQGDDTRAFAVLMSNPIGLTREVDVREVLAERRARGRLDNRQTAIVFVDPDQSNIITGQAPGSSPRRFQVEFESDAEVPGRTRRGKGVAGAYFQERVGGLLMPAGEIKITSYSNLSVINTGRSAGAQGPATTVATRTGSTVTAQAGVAAPDEAMAEAALSFLSLLDVGRIDDAVAQVAAGNGEHRAARPEAWSATDSRIRADYARRQQRGALSNRRVMLTNRAAQGRMTITFGAIGEKSTSPPRHGPNAMASSESVSLQLLDGAISVLDYRFGF